MVWLVIAVTYPFHPLLTFASIPVFTYVLLLVAQGPEYPDPFEEAFATKAAWPSRVTAQFDTFQESSSPAATEWSHVSLRSLLRNLGAACETLTGGRGVLGDRNLVREHVSGLVQDWLTGNGWKYRLVGVWLPDKWSVSPFGAVPEWWKVYRIALEDPSGMVRYGWIRFGDGNVAFQFEAERQQDAFLRDPFDAGKRRAGASLPEPMAVAVGPDPLWDRWIDP